MGAFLKAFKRRFEGEGLRVDWDDYAGEEWAQIYRDSTLLAFVWRRGPLGIVLEETAAYLEVWFAEQGLDMVRVSSFTEPSYCLDESTATRIHPTHGWPTDEVPLEKMSILDLYWSTV
jgi:hypothetical protein